MKIKLLYIQKKERIMIFSAALIGKVSKSYANFIVHYLNSWPSYDLLKFNITLI